LLWPPEEGGFFVYSHAFCELIRRLIHAIFNLIARVEVRGLERKGMIATGI
jgi:hypothetical protein